MYKHEHRLRLELIRVTRVLAERGLIRSSDGNISARLDADALLITPSGLYKAAMKSGDLIVVDGDGKVVKGKSGLRPTSETLMHLEAFRRRPDIGAVIHAHPPFATALSIAGKAFPVDLIPEVLIALGEVPTAPYATPGTQNLADSIRELIVEHDCILLGHHGSLTVGCTLDEALVSVERMEHAAYTCWISQAFGAPIPLPPQELEHLKEIGVQFRRKRP